ncbi:MAG: bifunctional UDP-N-acetylglucosamine diphosphorylase/glucosamine-1-phosphate N-acetyltransferase GlmU [Deltaproteobacteria bacterium]|nr:bifunctional UDP-N-acetylglucosamine diphosphorylase/glucosamine-1-phosphate N-acetyltransferase GlmU [Deltaproteobacteria bacterium]
MNNNMGALVLAAGKGTRMHSSLPKVLHTILGVPMLSLVINALKPIFPQHVRLVLGHQSDLVRETIKDNDCGIILQAEQLGTGHALRTAWPDLKAAGLEYVLVVNGDTPLLKTERLTWFIKHCLQAEADLAFMTLTLDDPASFGRVLRVKGKVAAVLEAKDYDAVLHGPEPKEINAGIYFLRMQSVEYLLDKLTRANKSNEYYITDLIALGAESGLNVIGLDQGRDDTLLGVNTPHELSRSEELLRSEIVTGWMQKGALIRNPYATRISPAAVLEPGCEICGPCEIYGASRIASGVVMESHIWANNVRIDSGTRVRAFSHLEDAHIGPNCTVGPFARLRPGSEMAENAHVGNFVEMKKTRLGVGSKANHLTYLGDAEIGAGVNIGAGTITCNYDGKHKHQTRIESGAFIGSNASLVAPVSIGENALVGAGSVITKDVPPESLAIAREKQKNLPRRPA